MVLRSLFKGGDVWTPTKIKMILFKLSLIIPSSIKELIRHVVLKVPEIMTNIEGKGY